jgi:hypothetical protein
LLQTALYPFALATGLMAIVSFMGLVTRRQRVTTTFWVKAALAVYRVGDF